MAEGVGFEPTTPISQGKRLAGARTRPLCDPSILQETTYILCHRVYFYNIVAVTHPPAHLP
jgi:hypothetical protein